jgi:NAD(P)-dependent dehydrogenase (short-subunit alcohol dehydrogenase family)
VSRPLTLVTGGGRGIGAATALRLAAAGHDLVLGYRSDKDAALDTAERVRAAGARCRTVAADVTDPAGVDELFEQAAEEGTLTGLVNNAGATLHLGDLADTPVEVIRRVVDLNLTGALLCARRAVLAMSTARGGQGGVIVNVSSGAATLGSAHEYVHYAAAKAGVDTLTLGLAQEVAGEGVRVNGVAPGIVRTDIHAAAGDPGRADRAAAGVPLGRPAEPAEVAAAIVWLLGDECPYMTGATLRVAGGR